MAKTPEEVIAKLQRRLENTGRHIVGLIDSNEGWKRNTKSLEEVLGWIHRKLADEAAVGAPIAKEICDLIEKKIPTYLKKKGQL